MRERTPLKPFEVTSIMKLSRYKLHTINELKKVLFYSTDLLILLVRTLFF